MNLQKQMVEWKVDSFGWYEPNKAKIVEIRAAAYEDGSLNRLTIDRGYQVPQYFTRVKDIDSLKLLLREYTQGPKTGKRHAIIWLKREINLYKTRQLIGLEKGDP